MKENITFPCSMESLTGPFLVRAMLTAGWVPLAVYAWYHQPTAIATVAMMLGALLAILWVQFFVRYFLCSVEYWKLEDDLLLHYQWCRCDQLHLLQVRDIYIAWTLLGRLLGVGTVVVVSHEDKEPDVSLVVDVPERVRDRIWHCIEDVRHRETVCNMATVPY